MATTIYYIEDIDCLRFALSATDYDIASFKPHFPGYAVYCFLLQCLYVLTGHLALSFSILGGIAIYLIIISTAGLLRLLAPTIPTWPLAMLIFFNPQLWIMSNSYMPDILGLGLLMCCLYCFANAYILGSRWVWIFHVLVGILLGVRLSYAPMILIPWVVLQWQYRKQIVPNNILLACTILMWLIPMVIDTGWHELVVVAKTQTDGHFNKWGGSVMSSKVGYGQRISSMMQSIVADGMGGWWPTRGILNMLVSLLLIGMIIAGKTYLIPKIFSDKTLRKKQVALYFFASLIMYLLWAFFGQNIVYKPRHTLPITPFICLVTAVGLYHGSSYFRLQKQALATITFVFLLPYFTVTAIGIYHHEQPTAISQMKDYLLLNNDQKSTFIGSGIMGFYMKKHYWNKGQLLEIQSDSNKVIFAFENHQHIFSTQNIDALLKQKPIMITTFKHDPFTNRMWADLTLYEYQK